MIDEHQRKAAIVIEATLFVGNKGRPALRLKARCDLLIKLEMVLTAAM